MGGTTSETFINLTLSTAASTNTVRLLKSISVSNILTLTQGGLDLNGKTLNITQNTIASIVRTSGYIKSENTSAPYGTITWKTGTTAGAFVYPFGKSSTEYIPVTFNITTAGSPNSATTSVSTYASSTSNTPLPSTVTNLNGTSGGNSVVDRFWILTDNSTYTTRPTATIIFSAVGGSSPTGTPPSERPATISNLATVATSPAGIAAQRWNSSGYWDAAISGQTFANNAPAANFFQVTIPAVSISGNSPWTLVDISVPLPIQLLEFKAKSNLGIVELNWRTATELNNDFFTVERLLLGEKFAEVLTVKGAGTKSSESKYAAIDQFPVPGKSYYRLKQTDFGGNFSYSRIVEVDVSSLAVWNVFPNPSNGLEFNVTFSSRDLGKNASIGLHDLKGNEMIQLSIENLTSTQVKVETPQKLAPGLYVISIAVGEQIERKKLLIL